MMKKTILLYLITLLLSRSAFSFEATELTGFWAMKPLNNGIANVVYFDEKNTLTLFPFKCINPNTFTKDGLKEEYQYKISGSSILLYTDNVASEEMKILSLMPETMIATEVGAGLTFEYIKVKEAKPLCSS